MTSNDARQYFKEKGLTYSDLTVYAIDLLASMLQLEIMKMRLERADCILTRINTPKFTRKQNNGEPFEWFEITAQGTYFGKREAVTFNRDGFIGFAGWASTVNTKPFIDGFIKWCDEMAMEKAND